MIDYQTANRIKDAANIVEVISDFVTLRRAGTNYKCLCPFHNEKTPSFMVSPSKGIFKCFSCGVGGDAVKFLMLHEQMSYTEALRYLARKYHIEVHEHAMTDEDRAQQSLRESLFAVQGWAAGYYQDNLYNTDDGRSVGLAYLRSRGLRDDIIKKFSLGYALSEQDATARAALAAGYSRDSLLKSGLCYERTGGSLVDKFRGRVIFPVQDAAGRIVAFGGRVVGQARKEVAKYLNSPETLIYEKRYVLYGLYLAKKAIQKADRVFLVEGYTDVISMHQSGIENVVASSGTSLTNEQIRLIRRFTSNLTVLYDGDSAGIKASLRGIDMLLEAGMNIKVLLLPDGDDPDSFARKHDAAEYVEYIDQHQEDFIRFKIKILMKDAGTDPVRRSHVIEDIAESICRIPSPVLRSLYGRECASLLGMSEAVVAQQIAHSRRRWISRKREEEQRRAARKEEDTRQTATELVGTSANETAQPMPAERPAAAASSQPVAEIPRGPLFKAEENVVRLLLKWGDRPMGSVEEDGVTVNETVADYIVSEMDADGLHFSYAPFEKILEECRRHKGENGFSPAQWCLRSSDAELSRIAVDGLATRYTLSPRAAAMMGVEGADEDNPERLVPRAMVELKIAMVRELTANVLRRMKATGTEALTPEERLAALEQFKALKEAEQRLLLTLEDRPQGEEPA